MLETTQTTADRPPGAASQLSGRARTRAAIAGALPADHAARAVAVVERLGDELDGYAELIAGPDDRVAGFLTRGEGAGFAERARIAFAELGLDAAAGDHHAALSAWFEHRRGFVKFEWARAPSGWAPAVACYFRRRPAVADALARLAELGVGPRSRTRIEALAGILDKRTVHFVSAAFRPGQPPAHKLYFSQLAAAGAREAVAARIERVFDLFEIDGPARESWRALHEPMLGPGEPTAFVSTSATGDAPSPSFKLDYAGVPAVAAARWSPPGDRPARLREIERLCSRAGAAMLSFLGVRFAPGEAAPAIKYYADVPRSSP